MRCECTYMVATGEIRCKAEATHRCGDVRLCGGCANRYRAEELTVTPLEEVDDDDD